MAYRRHNIQWLGVYRDDTNAYVGGSDIQVSGSQGYNSYLGFNSSAILKDLETSKVRPRIHLGFNVTNAATFDLGMHKETSDKKTSGLPYYAWTGRSFVPNTGEAIYDVTDFPISMAGYRSVQTAIKGGFHGFVLYGPRDSGNYGAARSAYIEIEGNWSLPPTKPELEFPVGGETLSGSTIFRTGPSTDPEGAAVTYQFSLKDGKTTHYFQRQSSRTLAVDLSKYTETSTAVVGVRAYDGESYSAWDYSNVFTLRYNIPPTQPTLLEPLGGISRDRTNTIRFEWNHNDQDQQSLFRFRWRLQGTTSWNTLQVVTTQELYAVPANTFPYGNIEWQVQTEDQGGLASPWSSTGLFLAAEKSDAPTILSPAPGAIIPSEELTVSWSSSGQVEYEVEVADGAGVFWQVSRSSGNKAVSVANPLQNNTAYIVKVRVRDSGGLWSDWATVSVATSFVPPPQPELAVTVEKEAAALFLEINNPLPGVDEPDVLYNELYRREPNGQWLLIATNLEPNAGFMDYTPAGETIYEYYVHAVGDNGTTMDSIPVIGSITLEHVRIQLTSDPTFYVDLIFNIGSSPKKAFSYGIESTKTQFAGRRRLVTEFGELSTQDISAEYTVKTSDMMKLIELLQQRETLLYRDRRGRKIYVTAENLQIGDRKSDYHSVSIPMSEVDYIEGLRR
ncbi:hypothetical protein [Planomicrobium sp. CPCC 101079]|uniref:hypothetical protein n=1 Tax=Planomicrobium sp. CPCC 101079 TaxID=2599618 RepID=UPI0011B53E3F|nr:hypothetical protein [Planomicrobium sp. CPCC 101079]TWT04599.1 hypothetical protein FQV28_08325 [Planomicrobium sp. CPCC 101079]